MSGQTLGFKFLQENEQFEDFHGTYSDSLVGVVAWPGSSSLHVQDLGDPQLGTNIRWSSSLPGSVVTLLQRCR